MKWREAIYLLVTLVSVAEASQGQAFVPYGMQTGYDASNSSFAAALVYNAQHHRLYVTGGTYDSYFHPGNPPDSSLSDCFVGVLQLPMPHLSGVNRGISWVRRNQYGSAGISETCSALQADVSHSGDTTIYLAGHAIGDGGLLHDLLPFGSVRRTVYGAIMEVNENTNLEGGRLLHSANVQYPVALDTDRLTRDVFVAAMQSEGDELTSELNGEDGTMGGDIRPPYGSRFTVILERLRPIETNEYNVGLADTLQRQWRRELGTHDHKTVVVSSIKYVGSSTLLLGGYTRGSGPAFAYNQDPRGQNTLDGFLTLLDPSTGDVVRATRIRSNSNEDDILLGLCVNPSNVTEGYAIGSTKGLFDTSRRHSAIYRNTLYEGEFAFLTKFDTTTLEVMWTTQIAANVNHGESFLSPPQVLGQSCEVTPDGDMVYMAGTVRRGAIPGNENHGGADIFLALLDALDGNVHYTRQIGTSQDDTLAQGNGLTTDRDGNAVLLGSTRGPMYRSKNEDGSGAYSSDVFVMSVERDSGSFLRPLEYSSSDSSDASASGGDPPSQPEAFSPPVREFPTDSGQSSKNNAAALFALASLLTFVSLISLLALVIHFSRTKAKKKKRIREYLHDLDGEWLIRESVTGGWHGTLTDMKQQKERKSTKRRKQREEQNASVATNEALGGMFTIDSDEEDERESTTRVTFSDDFQAPPRTGTGGTQYWDPPSPPKTSTERTSRRRSILKRDKRTGSGKEGSFLKRNKSTESDKSLPDASNRPTYNEVYALLAEASRRLSDDDDASNMSASNASASNMSASQNPRTGHEAYGGRDAPAWGKEIV